jgi:hypothetical protein
MKSPEQPAYLGGTLEGGTTSRLSATPCHTGPCRADVRIPQCRNPGRHRFRVKDGGRTVVCGWVLARREARQLSRPFKFLLQLHVFRYLQGFGSNNSDSRSNKTRFMYRQAQLLYIVTMCYRWRNPSGSILEPRPPKLYKGSVVPSQLN